MPDYTGKAIDIPIGIEDNTSSVLDKIGSEWENLTKFVGQTEKSLNHFSDTMTKTSKKNKKSIDVMGSAVEGFKKTWGKMVDFVKEFSPVAILGSMKQDMQSFFSDLPGVSQTGQEIETIYRNLLQVNRTLNMTKSELKDFRRAVQDIPPELYGVVSLNEIGEAVEGLVNAGVRARKSLLKYAPAVATISKATGIGFDEMAKTVFKWENQFDLGVDKIINLQGTIHKLAATHKISFQEMQSSLDQFSDEFEVIFRGMSESSKMSIIESFAAARSAFSTNWADVVPFMENIAKAVANPMSEMATQMHQATGMSINEIRKSIENGRIDTVMEGVMKNASFWAKQGNAALNAWGEQVGISAATLSIMERRAGDVMKTMSDFRKGAFDTSDGTKHFANTVKNTTTLFDQLMTRVSSLAAKQLPILGFSLVDVQEQLMEINWLSVWTGVMAFQHLYGAIKSLGGPIVNFMMMNPIAIKITSSVKKLAGTVSGFFKTFVGWLGTSLKAVGLFLKGVSVKILSYIAPLYTALMAKITGLFLTIKVGITTTITQSVFMSKAILLITKAFAFLKVAAGVAWAVVSGPIGAIVAGLLLLGVLLSTLVFKTRSFGDMWKSIKKIMVDAIQPFIDIFYDLGKMISEIFSDMFSDGTRSMNGVKVASEGLYEMFLNIVGVVGSIIKVTGKLLKFLMPVIKPFIAMTVWISATVIKGLIKIVDVLDMVFDTLSKFDFGKYMSDAGAEIGNLIDTFKAMFDFLANGAVKLGEFLVSPFVKMYDVAVSVGNKMISFFDSMIKSITEPLSAMADFLGLTAAGDAISGIWSGITGVVMAPIEALKSLYGSIVSPFNAVLTYDLPFVGSLVDLISWIKPIPAFAQGGYVSEPTLAMIGEAGPEWVVPEDKLRSGALEQSLERISKMMTLPDIPQVESAMATMVPQVVVQTSMTSGGQAPIVNVEGLRQDVRNLGKKFDAVISILSKQLTASSKKPSPPRDTNLDEVLNFGRS